MFTDYCISRDSTTPTTCRLGEGSQVPQKRPAQSPYGPSKSRNTAVSGAFTRHAEHGDRTPIDAAASSRSYLSAICDVLDRYPDGLGKEQITNEVVKRRADWWPDKVDDTVRRSLAVAFSSAPESKTSRIWEYERSCDGTDRKEKIWKRTSAPHDHQSGNSIPERRSNEALQDLSETSTAAHARTRSFALTPRTPSKTPDITDPTLQFSTGNVQFATHLWRPAHQSRAEDGANDARASAALNTQCNYESPTDDAQEGIRSNGNSMDAAVRSDSHATFTAPETATAIPDPQLDLRRNLPPTASEYLCPDLQVLHWGEQVRRRRGLVPQLDEMIRKRSKFSEEANRLHRRKEECSMRTAELEQQLQEAREHADNALRKYEKVQAEAAEVAGLVENVEKRFGKLMQSCCNNIPYDPSQLHVQIF
ncbi:hypothetical protein B0A54_16940 [Friedmanniomyces endolithicus]|uniref:Uncharacterized protein n=1 Tax=Friedmanniomyces endolithicus TaxID=329885 RepID=A0A4U0U0E2_9PEZI|nr:hypothetical protein B0A54_16940 [Friedmanniomyces endolithicus]